MRSAPKSNDLRSSTCSPSAVELTPAIIHTVGRGFLRPIWCGAASFASLPILRYHLDCDHDVVRAQKETVAARPLPAVRVQPARQHQWRVSRVRRGCRFPRRATRDTVTDSWLV